MRCPPNNTGVLGTAGRDSLYCCMIVDMGARSLSTEFRLSTDQLGTRYEMPSREYTGVLGTAGGRRGTAYVTGVEADGLTIYAAQ